MPKGVRRAGSTAQQQSGYLAGTKHPGFNPQHRPPKKKGSQTIFLEGNAYNPSSSSCRYIFTKTRDFGKSLILQLYRD
jgi:hypothetical protein